MTDMNHHATIVMTSLSTDPKKRADQLDAIIEQHNPPPGAKSYKLTIMDTKTREVILEASAF
jgi:hypothetical protein